MDATTAQTQLPEAGETVTKGKSGPKKSLVKRKVVGLNFSGFQNKQLTKLEMQLKVTGVELTRGRSEAAELAITFLSQILDGDVNQEIKNYCKTSLKHMLGHEDRYASGETFNKFKDTKSD